MTVKDILSHIVDNYYKIVVESFDHTTNLIKERYVINPHSCDYTNVPENILNTEVGMIVVHFNSLVISVSD